VKARPKKVVIWGRLIRFLKSKPFRIATPVLLLVIILLSIFVSDSGVSSANARGDGALIYGVAANTTPQFRTYSGASNGVSSAANTVAGATPQNMIIRASSTKQEMVAGYTDSTGVLQIMCYNGTSWTNEWSVTVGGNGSTRRFDIAYETNTGKVMVLYSTNAAPTNELAYRTKSGSTGCGSANWSSATNVDPVRTTTVVSWVRLAWDRRGSSNLLTAVWADSNTSLSAMQWSGSAWGNEPSAVLENALECIGTTGTCSSGVAPSTQVFDVEYESSSGDVMVVWGAANGTNGVNGARYAICTGGTSTCTWTNVGQISGTGSSSALADDAHTMDIAANPNSDEISFASIGDGGDDLQAAYWSGSAWLTQGNVDTTCQSPAAGKQLVATAWLINGSTTRRVITYADSSGNTISYLTSSGSADLSATATFTTSPTMNGANRNWYDLQTDPFNSDRMMFTLSDTDASANVRLFAKKIVMDSSGSLTLTNSDGSATLASNMPTATTSPFGFAYWRATSTYTQTSYRWYDNADSVQPGSAWANQNTAYSSGTNASIFRLRMGLTVATADMDANSQAFKLQYSSSTGGPWSDVDSNQNTWCMASTGVTCNTTWTSRRKITINNSASSTSLTNYPLLIKLNSARVDYSKTQNSGQDIRFVDPSDPTVVLPYEIEKWDESGSSYVWVKVPQIDASSPTDYIWMYYGNASASDGQSASNVWDSNFRAVYHSAETSGTTVFDSTSNANNATKQGGATDPAPTTGQISGAQAYTGVASSNSYLNRADNSTLDLTTFTNSAWFNATSLTGGDGWKTILCKDSSGSPNYCLQTNAGNIDINYGAILLDGGAVTTNTWYFVTATYDGSTLRLYLNGTSNASTSSASTPPVNAAALTIGKSPASNEFWPGTLDEIRVSSGARSADWIKADYLSQTDAMLTYSGEQDQSIDYTSGKWKFGLNPTAVNGTTITTLLLGGATTKQSYQETNPTVSNPTATPIGGIAEWDFALDPGSICGGTYYFRMVKDDGTALTTYSVYPQITLNIPSIVPVDQVMRGGKWFNNGVKQPYGCEWVSSH